MRIKKAVFPVAGLGTRFLPATKAMPKEMLPVVDKSIIQSEVPLLCQMINEFDRLLRASIVAAVEVPMADTSRYGILETEPGYKDTARIRSMVEKPKTEDAPSNPAAIGRYISPPCEVLSYH